MAPVPVDNACLSQADATGLAAGAPQVFIGPARNAGRDRLRAAVFISEGDLNTVTGGKGR